jgi:hypothetical protein
MASRVVDNLIALKILKMLVTPFNETDAYHLGIIDVKGKPLRKVGQLGTDAEKTSYDMLHRLVFSLKRILNKLPGGENKLKSLIAAYWLVKEQYQTGNKITNSMLEEKFDDIIKMLDNRVSLVEEEIIVKKFLEEDGMGAGAVGGAPSGIANVTGAGVSTDQPKIYKKDIKKYKSNQAGVISGMARRPKLVGIK